MFHLGFATGVGIFGGVGYIILGNLQIAALMVGIAVVLGIAGVGAAILSSRN